MPKIGEIKRGKELGISAKTNLFIWQACPDCGKERWIQLRNGKPISVRCKRCCRTQARNVNWKGGRYKDKKGYIHIKLQPNDFFYPMTRPNGYIKEHRLVVAKHLGRCLQPWEIVHHKKGFARDDNRYPETLQLVTEGQHNQITIIQNRINQLEKRITLLEAENALLKAGENVTTLRGARNN